METIKTECDKGERLKAVESAFQELGDVPAEGWHLKSKSFYDPQITMIEEPSRISLDRIPLKEAASLVCGITGLPANWIRRLLEKLTPLAEVSLPNGQKGYRAVVGKLGKYLLTKCSVQEWYGDDGITLFEWGMLGNYVTVEATFLYKGSGWVSDCVEASLREGPLHREYKTASFCDVVEGTVHNRTLLPKGIEVAFQWDEHRSRLWKGWRGFVRLLGEQRKNVFIATGVWSPETSSDQVKLDSHWDELD